MARAKNEAQKEETRLNLLYPGVEMRKVLDEIKERGHHGTVSQAIAVAVRRYQSDLRLRDEKGRVIHELANGERILTL